jgi:cytidylate kinase
MAIIAITQHVGTHGGELASLTAERLGYRLLTSEQLVAATSKRYNVPSNELAVVDERRPNFWTRFKTDTGRFVAFFRAVLLKEMAEDRLVTIGRSVAQLLPEHGCGVRVRLTGPFSQRAAVVKEQEGCTLALAEARVRDYDREVRARIQTLFGADIDDPVNYNLVLNVFGMRLATSAALLACLAGEADRAVQPENWRRMRDAALAAAIRAALISHPKLANAPLKVQCSNGAAQVSGLGLVAPWDKLVSEVARRVEGVISVEVVNQELPADPWQTY